MNAPPYPEPVSALFADGRAGTALLQSARPLRRFPVTEAPGFAIETSDGPEPVYLLGRSDSSEVPVPCRLCGTWNPAMLSGRHFFLAHEPDAALELTSVRRVQHHIGRLAFPSGWAASPWLSAPSRRQLLKRLHEFTTAFVEQRLERHPALSRAFVPAR